MEKDGRMRREVFSKFLKSFKSFLLFLVQLCTSSLDVGNCFPKGREIRLEIKTVFDEGFRAEAT